MITTRKPRHGISFWLVLLMTSLIVSACQPDGSPPPLSGTGTPSGIETPAGSEKLPTATPTRLPPTPTPGYLVPSDRLVGINLYFYHPWSGPTADQVESLVETFNQTNEWGIQVTAQRAGSSMALADIVEGSPFGENYPQVVVAPSEHLLAWLKEERLRPLNDFIADPEFGLSEQQRVDFPLVFWQQDQSNGSQAGIPAQRDMQVIYYNQSWAQELGFDSPPATPETFKEQACAAAEANIHDRFAANDGTGGWIVNSDGLVVYAWLKSFGLENALEGDPLAFHFNQPATQAAFSFLRSMYDEGCAWFARSTSSNEYFASRQALMYTGSLSELALQARTQTRLESDDVWTVLPFPNGNQPLAVASGLSYGVLRSDPARELASWLFVRWMSQPENSTQILLAGGGLPVSTAAGELAGAKLAESPQWAEASGWLFSVQSPPVDAGWRIARFVLQDALWQALQSNTTVEDIPSILELLDATIAEVQSVWEQ